MKKKELRFSLKAIYIYSGICAFCAVLILCGIFEGGGLRSVLDFDFVFCSCIVIGVPVFMLYQRKNNVLVYDTDGFSVNGKTYAFSDITEFKAVSIRFGTHYYIYVGEEIVFKFSIAYDNKDDFICLLQDSGVKIHV